MRTMKTAISIREPLFQEAEVLAREMKLSRSRLFALALDEFIQKRRNLRLLERINQACAEGPDAAERESLTRRKAAHRRIVRGEW